MNNLTRFENDGIEIFIDPSGNSFASIRGVARMAGKDEKQIRRFITADNISVINAEVPTATGLKTAALLSEDDIVAILAEYNIERLKQFAKLGVRVALHQIAGYQEEQPDRPNLDTFTIYDLKPWQIERLIAAIGYRQNNESIPAAYFEGMDDFDLPIWEIPYDVINWLQSLHQDLIEELTYRKCLESNYLSSNKVLQDYVRRFEADAAIRDYSQVRNMAESITPFEKIQLVEKELAVSKSAKWKPLGFGKPKK